jgi:trigger factor
MHAEKIEATDAVALEVKLPSLDGIRVALADPIAVSEDDIWERIDEWLAEASFKRARNTGEAIAEDDIVTLNVAGFQNGELLKGTLMRDWEVRATPSTHLPGFFEALIGRKVDETVEFDVTLSDEYPVESLRGETVSFHVVIQAAQNVRWGSLDDAVVLAKINKGASAEALVDAAAAELEEESMFAAQRETEGRVLDAVLERTEINLPAELVEAEMLETYAASEGQALREAGADEETQNGALMRFMSDEDERSNAEARICNNAVLHAVAMQYNLTPSLRQVGIEASEKELLLSGLLEQGRRQAALDFLVEKCTEKLN